MSGHIINDHTSASAAALGDRGDREAEQGDAGQNQRGIFLRVTEQTRFYRQAITSK